MSPRFVLGRENVPCVAEVVNRSLKADCTDFNIYLEFSENLENYKKETHFMMKRLYFGSRYVTE